MMSSESEIEARSRQLVFVAIDDGKIAGVTTAHEARVPRLNNNFFFNFRTLIHPAYRMPGLVDKLAVLTRDFLEGLYHSRQSECIGIVSIIENEQLKMLKRNAIYPSTEFMFVGLTKQGHHIRLYYFKGAKI